GGTRPQPGGRGDGREHPVIISQHRQAHGLRPVGRSARKLPHRPQSVGLAAPALKSAPRTLRFLDKASPGGTSVRRDGQWGKNGGAGMSDPQLLLTKISAWRHRREQARGLAREAAAAVAGLVQGNDPERLARLERQSAAGFDHGVLFDGVLRQLGDAPATNGETRAMPAQLTTRARRILERGREHLLALRSLADEPALAPAETPAGNPLATLYRETAAMTDTTLRTVQAFPDAPSVQLRLSEGLEAILTVIDQRLVLLRALVERRRLEESRIATLAELLQGLHGGQALDVKPYVAMAEAILDEAAQSAPLQFLHAAAEQPARFIACHSLTVAQVVARVVRQDPDLRGRPLEPVLAALVHDVGMLSV